MSTAAPLAGAINAATIAARMSFCAKTRRGAAIFWDNHTPGAFSITVNPRTTSSHLDYPAGWNTPPSNIRCDKSEACIASCGKRCIHAEQRAIRAALLRRGGIQTPGFPLLFGAELVHVKIDESGAVVPGGGPSCWQCSREILDVGIAYVWLLETTACPGPDCPMCKGEFCNICDASFAVRTATTDGARPRPAAPPNGGAVRSTCQHATDERHKGEHPPQGVWKRYTALGFHAVTCRTEKVHL